MTIDAETLRLLWAMGAAGGKATKAKLAGFMGKAAWASIGKKVDDCVSAGWLAKRTVKSGKGESVELYMTDEGSAAIHGAAPPPQPNVHSRLQELTERLGRLEQRPATSGAEAKPDGAIVGPDEEVWFEELHQQLDDQERRLKDLTKTVLLLTTGAVGGGKSSTWPADLAAQDAQVLAAVAKAADARRDRLAPLWVVRAALPDATRAELDATIHRLGVARQVELAQTDNQQLLTEDQAHALISNPHGAPTAYLSLPSDEDEEEEI